MRRALSTRAKAGAGAVIAALYMVGFIARGHVAAGIVGGVLAGVVAFLALREYERQKRR
jgi:hypothetical protein